MVRDSLPSPPFFFLSILEYFCHFLSVLLSFFPFFYFYVPPSLFSFFILIFFTPPFFKGVLRYMCVICQLFVCSPMFLLGICV